MDTIIRKIENLNIDHWIIKEAAGILQKGGLVAFPTETVYGLGANGLSASACSKIYIAKGRPSDNPLILHIGDLTQLNQIAKEVTPLAKRVMAAFWPGPLTLIFKKKECVPDTVTGGLDTVGIRFPSNDVAKALIKVAGFPVAAPSANSSGKPSPTKASHVEFDLSGKVDMIIDGGSAIFGLESTIVDVTGEVAIILRPGAITKEMLFELLGEVEIDPAILNKQGEDFIPKAPGMKYKHYAPKAKIFLVKGEKEKMVEKVNQLSKKDREHGLKVGVMATDETKDSYMADVVLSFGKREDLITAGSNLFKNLRKLDFLNVDVVYCEVFEEDDQGFAIMNRLNKAAGYNYIEV